jgi:hypothetical protein
MSDANRVQVSLLEEATWGTTPSSAFLELPITGATMSESPTTVRSNQLRSDAQFAGTKRASVEPSASFDFELQGDNLDILMRAALRNTASSGDWSTPVNIDETGDISAGASNTYVVTTANFTSQNIAVGQWIYVGGFTNAANNGWKKVAIIAAKLLTLATGSTTTTEAAGSLAITMDSSYIRNGAELTSFSAQMEYLDQTNLFRLITGNRINSFSLDISAQSIITGSIGMSGKTMTRPTAKSGSGSVTGYTENEVMSEVDAFTGFWIDGAEVTTYEMVSTSLNISANSRPQSGLGNLAKIGMQLGPLEVSGSMEFYLETANFGTLQDMLLNYTSFELAYAITDGAGHQYHIVLPKCHLTSEAGSVAGVDSDVMLSFDFAAEPATIGAETKTIQISRFV